LASGCLYLAYWFPNKNDPLVAPFQRSPLSRIGDYSLNGLGFEVLHINRQQLEFTEK
jgi:hypothetical protein